MTTPQILKYGLLAAMCVGELAAPSAAVAQYTFNPSNADEQGIHYFGSAKDEGGRVIPGAQVVVSFEGASFVFLTDETGRYRGTASVDKSPSAGKIQCRKSGFQAVKVLRRPGRTRPNGPSMQVDCVFRRA